MCIIASTVVLSSPSLQDVKFGGDLQLNYSLLKDAEGKFDGNLHLGAGIGRFSLLSTINFDQKNIIFSKPSINYGSLEIKINNITLGWGGVGVSSEFYSSSGDGAYLRLKDKRNTYLSYNLKEKIPYLQTTFNLKKYSLRTTFFKTQKCLYWEAGTNFKALKYLNFDISGTTYQDELYYKVQPTYSSNRYHISYEIMKTPFFSPTVDKEPLPAKRKELYLKYNLGEQANLIYKNRKVRNYNFSTRYVDIGFSRPVKNIFTDVSYSSHLTKDNFNLGQNTETNTTSLRIREFRKRQPLSLQYTHRTVKQIFKEKKWTSRKLRLVKTLELYPNGVISSFGVSRSWNRKQVLDDGYIYIFYPVDGKGSFSKKFLTLEYFTSSSVDEYDEKTYFEGITLRYNHYFGDDIYRLGEPRKTSLQGMVFIDKNGNHKKDKGEKGIKNIFVQLDGKFDAKTNKRGEFNFEEIEGQAAEITVETETLPDGYGIKDSYKKVTLKPSKKTKVYLPVQMFGRARGIVFEDKNDNNIFDEKDAPCRDIRVIIDDTSDWTTENGDYAFNVLPGEYIVKIDEESLPPYYIPKVEEVKVNIVSSKEVIILPLPLQKIEYILKEEKEEEILPEIKMVSPPFLLEILEGPMFTEEKTPLQLERKFKEKGLTLSPLSRKFTIYFDEGETKKVKLDMKRQLDECVLVANSYPDYIVYLNGHSDIYEDEMAGFTRARTLSNYLINTGKLKEDRVYFYGLGKTNPLATSETPAGRARNRRVEITIYLTK